MKSGVKNILTYLLISAGMLAIISFANIKRSGKMVKDVQVDVRSKDGNYFTDNLEILNLLNEEQTGYVLESSLGDLELKSLETNVENHPFVKDAQVFKDLKGNLVIEVEQRKPIARIFDVKGEDQYIDEEGFLLPTKGYQAARVMLIELEHNFSWSKNVNETEYGQQLLELLRYVERDEFWQAQIAHLIVEQDGEITMLPQVTKQEILFGKPKKLKSKFKKLKVFYTEILPNKGWNTYQAVNLKFENQIVCE